MSESILGVQEMIPESASAGRRTAVGVAGSTPATRQALIGPVGYDDLR